MKKNTSLYATSLALLTDFYQLTMAYGYWKTGLKESEAVFHLTFRNNPFGGGYSVACGLEPALDFIENFSFTDEDIDFLRGQKGNDGFPIFADEFLEFLRTLRLTCDIDAVMEGTLVFPHEPLLRIKGPIVACQLLETPLLTLINFQTLIATKAARVVYAAQGDSILEFGLRRAQGIDGGLAASRAAYIGGCAATSNTLAGKLYGIPVRGTHAHSWVMAFDSETEAFAAYAEALPNNGVFLVDTYDSLQGVVHAISAGQALRAKGHELAGIRLDSGDLAYLSRKARHMLDASGFPHAKIFASNELDEYLIESLKSQGACVSVWGVGTRLVTAFNQPALGGVYKLSALRKPGGAWEHRLKLSEQVAKTSNPGILQIKRYSDGHENLGDMIYDELLDPGTTGASAHVMVDPMDPTRRKRLDSNLLQKDLLVPVMRAGQRVGPLPDIEAARTLLHRELASFHEGIKRFVNPHQYPVGLRQDLHNLKTKLVLKSRGFEEQDTGD